MIGNNFESKESNKINEYLSKRNEKGTFPVDEILASRAQEKPSSNIIDPFQKMMKPRNKGNLRSYKDARAEKQKGNIQKQIDNKINNFDNEMIDKLANLMNMFEIGESMPIEGNLQQMSEIAGPSHHDNSKFHTEKKFEGDSEFETTHGTQDDNPFTKKSNFLAYHTLENSEQALDFHKIADKQKMSITSKKQDEGYQLPEDDDPYKDEEDYDFPSYIKNKNPLKGENILRPVSSKHSKRYSKC